MTDKLGGGKLHHAVNWALAQRCTTKPIKAFFAMGPVELSMFLKDEYYGDRKRLLADMADIYHAEIQDAVNAGARIVELDDLIFLAPQDEWASTWSSSTACSMASTPTGSGTAATAARRDRSVWRRSPTPLAVLTVVC